MADIRAHQGAIVVIDSLRSITRSAGISENDQAMGNLVYDLKQVTTDVGGTLLLVHHGNKKGGTGQDASSGHSSITGACNGVLSIHYLEDENGRPKKDSQFRRLVREARSGQGFDKVVRMNTGGCFEHIADYESFLRQQEQDAKQVKTTEKLRQPPKAVKRLLEVLALQFDEKLEPVGLIDLLKGSKLCRKQVQSKGDLKKDEINAYQQCMDWAAKLEAQKYLIKHKDSSDTPGSQRRYLWELSRRPQFLQAVKQRLLTFLPYFCAAGVSAKGLDSSFFRPFYPVAPHGKGKRGRRVTDFFLAKALCCRGVRRERKERLASETEKKPGLISFELPNSSCTRRVYPQGKTIGAFYAGRPKGTGLFKTWTTANWPECSVPNGSNCCNTTTDLIAYRYEGEEIPETPDGVETFTPGSSSIEVSGPSISTGPMGDCVLRVEGHHA